MAQCSTVIVKTLLRAAFNQHNDSTLSLTQKYNTKDYITHIQLEFSNVFLTVQYGAVGGQCLPRAHDVIVVEVGQDRHGLPQDEGQPHDDVPPLAVDVLAGDERHGDLEEKRQRVDDYTLLNFRKKSQTVNDYTLFKRKGNGH